MTSASPNSVTKASSVPGLEGREAAYLLRALAAARRRNLPLLLSVATTGDIVGLPQIRKVLPVLEAAGENGILDAVEAALQRGVDAPAAAILKALRQIGLPGPGVERLGRWCSDRATGRSELFRAVSYPITLMVTMAVLFIVVFEGIAAPLLTGVFTENLLYLFQSTTTKLPALTRLFIAVFSPAQVALREPWSAALYLIGVLSAACAFLRFTSNLPDRPIALHIPMVSRYVRLQATQSFASTLGLLLAEGVEMPVALGLAANAVSNRRIRAGLAAMVPPVVAGESLGELIRQAAEIPRSMAWRLWSAYFRGDLVAELVRVSEACALELGARERRVRSVATAIAWMLVLLLLVPVVAVFLVSMYLPMYNLVQEIG